MERTELLIRECGECGGVSIRGRLEKGRQKTEDYEWKCFTCGHTSGFDPEKKQAFATVFDMSWDNVIDVAKDEQYTRFIKWLSH